MHVVFLAAWIAVPGPNVGTVRVTTLLDDGTATPIVGTTLRLSDEAGASRLATTDASGEATFSDIPPGSWRVETVDPRYDPIGIEGLQVTADRITSMTVELSVSDGVEDLRVDCRRPSIPPAPPPATP